MFTKIEEKLFEDPKDSSFYYHSSEDRMVLSQDRTYVANTSKMAIEK